MTSVFDTGELIGDHGRAAPIAPVTMTPRAAGDGGEDSGGGLGLDFWVGLGASLGTLVNDMRADRDAAAASTPDPPGDTPLFQAGLIVGGTLTLDLGSVPQGRVWQIRRLIVGGIKVTTTAAGTAYAFAQGAPPTDLNLTSCVDIFSSLPQGNTYGTHQLFLLPGEHLFVVFQGATNGQQYAASARVEDWAQADFSSTFVE